MNNILQRRTWLVFGFLLFFSHCTARLAQVNSKEESMEEARIVWMGNSITEQWPMHRPEFFDGKPWINKGISGQVTWEMLNRFEKDVIDLNPDIVVIMAGTNDVAGNQGPATQEEIIENIKNMIGQARASGITVILCSIPPAADFPWNPGQAPALRIPALNMLLKAYAEENGIIYADYFSAMKNLNNGMKDGLATDGVHPNAAGYALMEEIITESIARSLKMKK